MAYNPSIETAVNKPLGITGKPADARTYFHDLVNFTYRPYQNTAEVLAYLITNDRKGHFPIIINTGGSLSSGVITGGTNAEYWFKDGITDGDLVLKGPPPPAIAMKTGNYTIQAGDDTILCNTTSADITITWNPALDNKIRRIKNVGAAGHNVIITPSSGNIEGELTNIVGDGEVRTIQSNSTNLYLLS